MQPGNAAPPWGGAAPGSPPPPAWTPGGTFEAPPKTSALAIVSLVSSLLWMCGVGSLVAVITGIIGIKQTGAGKKKGRGLAIAGLIIGLLGLVGTIGIGVAVSMTAEETVVTQAGEKDDVTITSCGRDAAGFGVAELSVTNDSSKTSDYIIGVEFVSDSATFEGTFDGVVEVDPDETALATVTTTEVLSGTGDVTCELTLVQRFASR